MVEWVERIRSANRPDRERLVRLADGLTIALAASLPWSTSATGILAALWLVVTIPTLEAAALRRVVRTPAGGLPVLFWLLGLVGMLWAIGVPFAERLDGLSSFHRLLFVPLLIVQFRRSERALGVMIGFLISCCALLALSWALLLMPQLGGLWSSHGGLGIPVKDYIAQSTEFTVCIFFLAAIALEAWQKRRPWMVFGSALLALMFLANIFYVQVSRTALVMIPALLVLFACKQLPWKGAVGLFMAAAVVGVLGWSFAPNVRNSVTHLMSELQEFRPQGASTRAGERLEFWKKSVEFIADAPIIGHGTGSIRDQFRRSVTGQTGMAAVVSANPHNQTLAVAIQLGFVGTAVLFAMWIAHASLFRGGGFAAWAGLVIVTQNIVGSLFNSHLFDFTQGWGYVVGVGVAGGVIFKTGARQSLLSAGRRGALTTDRELPRANGRPGTS